MVVKTPSNADGAVELTKAAKNLILHQRVADAGLRQICAAKAIRLPEPESGHDVRVMLAYAPALAAVLEALAASGHVDVVIPASSFAEDLADVDINAPSAEAITTAHAVFALADELLDADVDVLPLQQMLGNDHYPATVAALADIVVFALKEKPVFSRDEPNVVEVKRCSDVFGAKGIYRVSDVNHDLNADPSMFKNGAFVMYITSAIALHALVAVAILVQPKVNGFTSNQSVASFVVATFNLGQLVASPFWNRVSDSWGRKNVMVTIYFIYFIAYIAHAQATNTFTLWLARLFAGFAAMIAPVGQTFLADVCPPRQRTASIGMLNAFVVVGQTTGILASRYFTTTLGKDWDFVCYYSSAIMLVVAILCFVFLPESAPLVLARRARKEGKETPSVVLTQRALTPGGLFKAWGECCRNKNLVLLVLGYFAMLGACTAISDNLFAYMSTYFGYTRSDYLLVSIWGSVFSLLFFFTLPHFMKHFGEVRGARFTNYLCLAAVACFSIAPTYGDDGIWYAFAGIVLYNASLVYCHPSWLSMASLLSTPEIRGSVLAFTQLGNSLGRSIPTIILGNLVEYANVIAFPSLFLYFAVAVFCIGNVVVPFERHTVDKIVRGEQELTVVKTVDLLERDE
jgi:MFS family permease